MSLGSLTQSHIAARFLAARAARAGRRLWLAPGRQLREVACPAATAPSRLLRRAERGLRREGFAVVPGFVEQARCRSLLEASDPTEHDACIRFFSESPSLRALAVAYLGVREPKTNCRLRREIAGHDDSQWRQRSSAELVALLYLESVGQSQGPLELLPGSHKLPRALRSILSAQAPTSRSSKDPSGVPWSEEAVESLVRRRYAKRGLVSLAAPAGSLVVYDGALLHRNGPVSRGQRALLELRFSTA